MPRVGELRAGAVPVLLHPEPRRVLGDLAATVYGTVRAMAVVGVTGTSGKTTTTYLIEAGAAVGRADSGADRHRRTAHRRRRHPQLADHPEAPALQALLAVMAERGVDTVVMEVSSHALTLGRVDGIAFAVGGFTNLSRDHLDFHPTMEDYFEAKARLFDPARRCAPAPPWCASTTMPAARWPAPRTTRDTVSATGPARATGAPRT